MPNTRTTLLVACLLAAIASQAHASPFTAFAEDEDTCRRTGTQAIGEATGPQAAQHYDRAYRVCMATHIRTRQMAAYPQPPDGPPGNPHSFDYPDAFYSIPYATPGYGYDGFSD